MSSRLRHWQGVMMIVIFVAGLVASAAADESAQLTGDTSTHPLSWTFRYATARSDYIRQNIRDYSCRLIKRERIDGELQKHQFIQVKMRCEQRRDGDVLRPMSVFMRYLAPGNLKDRRVLYVDGQNDGMMLVRKGGRAFKFVKLEVDPHGASARRESNYPITDIGFDKIIERLLERVASDIRNDPEATNTLVSNFRDAKVGTRICTHIQVVHPNRGEGIEFHKASLYVDDELNVPIRLVVHDWPSAEGLEPPLLEEYIYVDLELNVGLTDADFSKRSLDSSADGT